MMDRVEKNTVLEGANAMPAPTWHYLQMNDVSIEVPASLRVEPAVATAVSDEAVAPAGTFEYSLAMLQSWWDARWPLRAPADVMRPAESDAAYGGTAQSAYQRNADALEVSQSLEAAFATGVGADTASLLAQAAGEPVVIASDEGQRVRATVTDISDDSAEHTKIITVEKSSVGHDRCIRHDEYAQILVLAETSGRLVTKTVQAFDDNDAVISDRKGRLIRLDSLTDLKIKCRCDDLITADESCEIHAGKTHIERVDALEVRTSLFVEV